MTSFSDDNDSAPSGGGAVGQEIADHELEADTQPTVITPFAQQADLPVPGFASPEPQLGDFHADDILPVMPVGGRRSRRESGDGDPESAAAGASTYDPQRSTPSPLGRLVVPIALALVSAVALFAAWSHLQDNTSAPTVPVGAGGPVATAPPVAAFRASPQASTSSSAAAPSDSPSSAVSLLNCSR
jgi:hypothetical protein